jgi:nucleoside-diphosphate-sugar epimerase
MKALLLGATGNLGTRLVPALLTHGHRVVAFVRSSSKLQSLLPASAFQQITVVEGDATNSNAVKRAILDNECDAVVSAAGVAALHHGARVTCPRSFAQYWRVFARLERREGVL